MSRQILFFLIIFGFCCKTAKAQDPIFSQFYAAPLQLNPALAGNTEAPHIALNYRNQWPTLNAYQTYSVAVDRYFKNLNSGLGLMILSDDAGQGLITTNRISGIYSYRLKVLEDLYVKLGVELSAIQSKYNWDRLIFLDQIGIEGPTSPGGSLYPTDEIRPEKLTKTYFDSSIGLILYSPMFYGGLTIKHLNTPNESLLSINDNLNTGLPMRFTLHGGAQIPFGRNNKKKVSSFISPNIMLIKQGDFGQVNVGTYVSLGFIFGGVWYRHAFTNADAAIFLVGVKQGIFKIGYSYDVTVSGLSGETGGSHEISLILNFEKPKAIDFNDCFNLFR